MLDDAAEQTTTEPHDDGVFDDSGRHLLSTELTRRLNRRFKIQLDQGEQSALVAWASFGTTFGATRALTHWIRAGHGPQSGGMSFGGRHFHHYNIGIALLTGIGVVAIRGQERHRRHPLTAISYGVATALIADEAALLIDLQDVYWAKEGRKSVDAAIGVIALGSMAITGSSFWPAAAREIKEWRAGR